MNQGRCSDACFHDCQCCMLAHSSRRVNNMEKHEVCASNSKSTLNVDLCFWFKSAFSVSKPLPLCFLALNSWPDPPFDSKLTLVNQWWLVCADKPRMDTKKRYLCFESVFQKRIQVQKRTTKSDSSGHCLPHTKAMLAIYECTSTRCLLTLWAFLRQAQGFWGYWPVNLCSSWRQCSEVFRHWRFLPASQVHSAKARKPGTVQAAPVGMGPAPGSEQPELSTSV